MKVESIGQGVCSTIVMEDSNDVYLRVVLSGDGLMPLWYQLTQEGFDAVHNDYKLMHDLESAYILRNR